jgi:hypothetical protein
VVRVQVPEAGRRLCDVHPQAGQVGAESRFHHAGAGWALATVPPCGHGMGAGCGSAVWPRDGRGSGPWCWTMGTGQGA